MNQRSQREIRKYLENEKQHTELEGYSEISAYRKIYVCKHLS